MKMPKDLNIETNYHKYTTWPFFAMMLFLRKQISFERRGRNNNGFYVPKNATEKSAASAASLSDLSESDEETPQQNLVTYSAEMPTRDEDEYFFDSLLPHVRRLQGRAKLLCHSKIQQIVFNFVYEENNTEN